MPFRENISLGACTSFGIHSIARYFSAFSTVDDLQELLMSVEQLSSADSRLKTLILGGGSNLLLCGDFNGFVLKNEIAGINEVHEDNEFVYVKAGAGENWHRFVQYCISRDWAGAENLSLIPGNVGASPMQNIGAYGVELEDIFWGLEAWHIKEQKLVTFTKTDCAFGYRESVFKRKFRDQFVILNVTFQLRKKPRFNTQYGAIEQELALMGVKELSIKAIADAVIRIRSSKLPDPAVTGNAGSFFKNPSIQAEQFAALKKSYPNIVGYPNSDGTIKLAAGWLIENTGPDSTTSWKGFRRGDAGCHSRQALVLVNYGNASGQEVFHLSEEILQSVKSTFGVELEREVNVVGCEL